MTGIRRGRVYPVVKITLHKEERRTWMQFTLS